MKERMSVCQMDEGDMAGRMSKEAVETKKTDLKLGDNKSRLEVY